MFSDSNWMSNSSLQFWHSLPGVSLTSYQLKGFASQNCPTSDPPLLLALVANVVPRLPTLLLGSLQIRGFPWSPPPPPPHHCTHIQLFSRPAHRTHVYSLLEKIQLRNIQIEEIYRPRCGERDGECFFACFGCIVLLALRCAHQPESSHCLGLSMEASLPTQDWLNHIVIGDWTSPALLPSVEFRRWG